MKLNEDIISRELEANFKIDKHYQQSQSLHLLRPVLFRHDIIPEDHHICIGKTEQASQMLPFATDGLYVLIGETASISGVLSYIVVHGSSISEVMNSIQSIFDRYGEWETNLGKIWLDDSDIKKMVELTSPLLGNTITILNNNLEVLAESEINDGHWTATHRHQYANEKDYKVIAQIGTNLPKPGAFYKEPNSYAHDAPAVYGRNIFAGKQFIGTSSLVATECAIRNEDRLVFDYFTTFIEQALNRRHQINKNNMPSLRGIVEDVLQGRFIDNAKIVMLLSSEIGKDNWRQNDWLCAKIDINNETFLLPVDYVCKVLENVVPHSIALYYDSSIVLAVSLSATITSQSVGHIIDDFLARANTVAGISNTVSGIMKLPIAYRQAATALQVGTISGNKARLYLFSEQVLPYMLDKARGDFNPQDLLPEGLIKLAQHDAISEIDYWQTLKVFLENDRNATTTARILYLHRSTLLQRMAHIEDLLGHSLDDSKWRLQLLLCINMVTKPSIAELSPAEKKMQSKKKAV